MNNPSLDQLKRLHASAKKKLILGIVFSAVALFIEYIGLITLVAEGIGIIFIILSLPFWGVGIPFLVIGLVNTIKLNRKISLAGRNNNYSPAVPVSTEPVVVQQAQVATQPVATVNPVVKSETQPIVQLEAQPIVQSEVQQEVQPAADETEKNFDIAQLDWQKYNPLDAGVSYNKDKNYKFHRAEGFAGSVPQNFVNRTFPKCPICCTNEPYWTIAQHNQMSWKGNLYLFKCSHCESIISMSMPDVTTLGNGAGGVATNPSVGLTNLMVKASSGKEVGAVYAVIESVGNSGVSRECEGKEFKLENLQEMFSR